MAVIIASDSVVFLVSFVLESDCQPNKHQRPFSPCLVQFLPLYQDHSSLIKKIYWSIVDLQCFVSFRCMQNESVKIYIYPFFLRLFSHIGFYRILNRFPCAIQWVLAGYLFNI